MSDEIPQWVEHRVTGLVAAESATGDYARLYDAFVRYISEHEEPPVDLVLLEARKVVARQNEGFRSFASEVLEGGRDDHEEVQIALSALKRGMELARETSDAS